MDSGKLTLYGVAADGVGLDKVEAAMDAVLAEIKADGVTAQELARAKSNYIAEYVYESDSQATLARRYGWGLVVGRSLADIDAWPERLQTVTAEDVRKVAQKYFDIRKSVTGTLLPVAPDGASAAAARPAAPGRS
jgi:zinc protease